MKKALISSVLLATAAIAPCFRSVLSAIDVPSRASELACAIAGHENITANLRRHSVSKIDGGHATMTISASGRLTDQRSASPCNLCRPVGRIIHAHSDHEFFGIEHPRQLVEDSAEAGFFIASRDDHREGRMRRELHAF